MELSQLNVKTLECGQGDIGRAVLEDEHIIQR